MGMDVFMEFTVCELFKDGDRVIGCMAYDRQRGRAHLFKSKSIVLATKASHGVVCLLWIMGIYGRRACTCLLGWGGDG